MSSALMPLKMHRVERLMYVISVEAQSSPLDLVWKFEEVVPAYMSFDHDSKLRGLKPIAFKGSSPTATKDLPYGRAVKSMNCTLLNLSNPFIGIVWKFGKWRRGDPKKEKRGGDPEGEVEEKSSEKTGAGRLRKRRGESQSFFIRVAVQESKTRMRNNALRTGPRQAVERAVSKRGYHTGYRHGNY
ncbi:hypothetical protein TNCV_4613401 [Trichonephila clavipes]|nr:hypothetical protein TNCV_4613401 [Trichonephila clavipes]